MKIHEHMLDYVIDLLDDATDFSWPLAKDSYVVLLCRMEQGEIKSWLDTEQIDRVHRTHAQRHNTGQTGVQRAQDKHSSAKTTTCIYYNKGVCSQKKYMRQKVSYISMFVPHVGPRMVSHILIPDQML